MGEAADMAVWDEFEQDLSQDHDALYREHYPKFVQRRAINGSKGLGTSPRSPYNTKSQDAVRFDKYPPHHHHSSSDQSSVALLSPPPLFRRVTLPTPALVGFDPSDRGIDATILPPPPCSTFFASSKPSMNRYPVSHSPTTPTMQNLHKETHSPRSPFVHLPERHSAPKRPLDLCHPGSSWLLGRPSSRLSQETVAPLKPNNSLGLEIQHIEDVPTPGTPPYHGEDENRSPVQSKSYKTSVVLKATQNPVSPPRAGGGSSRSPLAIIHIPYVAPGVGLCDEGIRSVEAAKYELGREEANYIARKLAEEQKKRMAKERAAKEQDPFETRGRSRTKKRAASYSSGSILG